MASRVGLRMIAGSPARARRRQITPVLKHREGVGSPARGEDRAGSG